MAIYNDYIRRKTVFNVLNDIGGCGAPPESWADGWDKAIGTAIDIINRLPSADVEPVKHGRWINFYGNYKTAECSVCEELYEVSDMRESNRMLFEAFSRYYKYCPHCGAKMDGEEVQE